MQINTKKLKKLILSNLPYVIFAYAGNKIAFAYRVAEGSGFEEKLMPFMSNLGVSFAKIFPSFHPIDILFGLALAAVMKVVLYIKSKNRKKFRQGEEYGSAVWGAEKDIEPYMDNSDADNNVILTKTEFLTMGRPSSPKYARNKNILVIGGSGSGIYLFVNRLSTHFYDFLPALTVIGFYQNSTEFFQFYDFSSLTILRCFSAFYHEK